MRTFVPTATLAIAMAVGMGFLCASPAAGADADKDVQTEFDRLVRAIQTDNRDQFVQGATDDMKKAITPQLMHSISTDLSPHMAKGFQATYLCELNQHGFKVYLWKVSFTDGSDDTIVRMVMQGNSLAGFFRQ